MDIVCIVKNQELNITSPQKKIAKSINYLRCVFEFETQDWEGAEKTAYFLGTDGRHYSAILKNDACLIPWEAIQECGRLIMSVTGVKNDGTVITTEKISMQIGSTLSGGNKSKEPSPDQYTQIMQALAGKVGADQGAENAGKILGIGEDGVVAPVDAPAGSGSGAVSKDDIREAVEEYMKKNPVEVKTTDVVEKDNTLPVTSAGVYTVCGNIEALLQAL